MSELIIVKQLPIIEEQLKTISDEIDVKITYAKSLVCTEETVKEIKVIRADLNKDFSLLEDRRKAVKFEVMAPYEAFEKVYKLYVSDKFKQADSDLKTSIAGVEDKLKAEKETEIKNHFTEYAQSLGIPFVTFERLGINITLSTSVKSLKEQITQYLDKIVDDLALIETQENKAEILVEYKQSLNVSQAITTVCSRFKAIEAEKQRQLDLTTQKELAKQKELEKELEQNPLNVDIFDKILATVRPKEEPKKEFTLRLSGTQQQYDDLIKFLKERGYIYV